MSDARVLGFVIVLCLFIGAWAIWSDFLTEVKKLEPAPEPAKTKSAPKKRPAKKAKKKKGTK